ncbi:nitrate reductase cytochrome c-type subunit [Ferrimonas aestuarii]|uniref:Periplasmic nitrate reductase, electron transfer subunit n=1 Tax=Ferrimonas aestuarii TaxID=2569539 RepID=A0A4V5NYM8_9GAMM|nr:nitrate reductase cytochrome c-type subunit [Ferrimonas aestuarii]TKB50705.1 nitrate reductase cytochrome c-type subunit; periplasmic nitrate reductase electron transfer subunit [Ferrimonas aestuarii]
MKALVLATALLGLSINAVAADSVESLRGANPAADNNSAEAIATYPKKGKAMERSMLHQPPLIPHKASYPITLKKNGCVTCHAPKKAKRMKTTAIHESHYESEGKLDNIYYNCNQCHVPQASNAEPLVGNNYSN